MKDEKSYVETERMREQSELGRKEEKIVNCVDISDNQKVFIKFSTVTYRNLLKWIIIGGISGILTPFFQVAMLGVIVSLFCCFSILSAGSKKKRFRKAVRSSCRSGNSKP